MEVLRRRGRVRDSEIALGDQLEKALEPRAGVFRTLTFVSVRQQQREIGVLTPLGPVSSDKLIDDRLCDVGEVAELRFPEHEIGRHGGAEAILESQYGRLGERAVIDLV